MTVPRVSVVLARGTRHGPFGTKFKGTAGQASLPAMVVRASRPLPRSPRVSQRYPM